MRKLTDQQIEQLVAWREQGWGCKRIADHFGVSVGAVTYQCLRHGAISPHQTGRDQRTHASMFIGRDGRAVRRFTPDEDSRLQALGSEGMTLSAIARAMDRPRTSVRLRLLLLGVHEDIAA